MLEITSSRPGYKLCDERSFPLAGSTPSIPGGRKVLSTIVSGFLLFLASLLFIARGSVDTGIEKGIVEVERRTKKKQQQQPPKEHC